MCVAGACVRGCRRSSGRGVGEFAERRGSSQSAGGGRHLAADPSAPACHSTPPPAVAFRIYDADDDGFVAPADLLRQLQATNRRGLSAAQLQQVVAATVAEFDADRDGRLNFDEFRALAAAASSGERAKALAL